MVILPMIIIIVFIIKVEIDSLIWRYFCNKRLIIVIPPLENFKLYILLVVRP